MKLSKGMQLGAMLAAMLLVSVVFVPAVSAQESNGRISPDAVDKATVDERTPSFIKELRNKGFSEAEIAKAILNLSTKYQDGWTDEDNKRVVGNFKKVQEGLKNNTLQSTGTQSYVQKNGAMVIDETNYRGVNGYVRPSSMEVSSSGTQIQYVTSHLGAAGTWIEVGVARFYWNPNEYVVYTVDSTQPSDQQWKTWGIANPNIDNNFETYVHDFNDGQGYPYYIAWNGIVIRTGHVPFAAGNPSEDHEYFAASASSFTPVSLSYFKESYLYRGNTALWWNGYLPETTHYWGDLPVRVNRYIPSGSNAYKIDSWIP
ncbi:MAG: hypothetical protein O8C63_12515 [Candidatus Methanoperedens sp.]|nr:hypothetical protein [Candidatus Methanoperedens sp.]